MIDLKKPLPQELIDLPESDFQMIQRTVSAPMPIQPMM